MTSLLITFGLFNLICFIVGFSLGKGYTLLDVSKKLKGGHTTVTSPTKLQEDKQLKDEMVSK